MADFDNEVARIREVLAGLRTELTDTRKALSQGLAVSVGALARSFSEFKNIGDPARKISNFNAAVNAADIARMGQYATELERIAAAARGIPSVRLPSTGGAAGGGNNGGGLVYSNGNAIVPAGPQSPTSRGISLVSSIGADPAVVNAIARTLGAALEQSYPGYKSRGQTALYTTQGIEHSDTSSQVVSAAANVVRAAEREAEAATKAAAKAAQEAAKQARDLANANIAVALSSKEWSTAERLIKTELASNNLEVKEAVALQRQLLITQEQLARAKPGGVAGALGGGIKGFAADLVQGAAYSAAYGLISQLESVLGDVLKVRNDLADIQRQLQNSGAGYTAEDVSRSALNSSANAGQPFIEGVEVTRRSYRLLGEITDAQQRLDAANRLAETTLGTQTVFNLTLDQSLESVPALFTNIEQSITGVADPARKADLAITALQDRMSKFLAVSRETGAEGNELVQTFAKLAPSAKGAGLSYDQLTAFVAAGAPRLGLGPDQTANVYRAITERPFSGGGAGGATLLAELGIQNKIKDTYGNEVRRPILSDTRDANGVPIGVIDQILEKTSRTKEPLDQYARALGGPAYASQVLKILESIRDGTYKRAQGAVAGAAPDEFAQTLQKIKDQIGPTLNTLQAAFAGLILELLNDGGSDVIVSFLEALTDGLKLTIGVLQNPAVQSAGKIIGALLADILTSVNRFIIGLTDIASTLADPRTYIDSKFRDAAVKRIQQELAPSFGRTSRAGREVLETGSGLSRRLGQSQALEAARQQQQAYLAQARERQASPGGSAGFQPPSLIDNLGSEQKAFLFKSYEKSTQQIKDAVASIFGGVRTQATKYGEATDTVSAASRAQIILDRASAEKSSRSDRYNDPLVADQLRSQVSSLSGEDYTRAIDSARGIPAIMSQLQSVYDALGVSVQGVADGLFQLGPQGQQYFSEMLKPLTEAVAAEKEILALEQALAVVKGVGGDEEQEMAAKIESQLRSKRELYKTQLAYLSAVRGEKNYVKDILEDTKKYVGESRKIQGTPAQFNGPGLVDTKGFTVEQIRQALDKTREQQAALIKLLPAYAEEFKKSQFLLQSGTNFSGVTGVNPGFFQQYLTQQKKDVRVPDVVDFSKYTPEKQTKILKDAQGLQDQATKLFPELAPEFAKERVFILKKNNELLQQQGLSQQFLREAIEKNTESQDELRGHFNIPGGYSVPTIWGYYNDGGRTQGDVNYPGAPGGEVSIELAQQLAQQSLAGGETNPDISMLGSLLDPNAAPLGFPNPGTPGSIVTTGPITVEGAIVYVANASGAFAPGAAGKKAVDNTTAFELDPYKNFEAAQKFIRDAGQAVIPGTGSYTIDSSALVPIFNSFLTDLKAILRNLTVTVNLTDGKSVTTLNNNTSTLQTSSRSGDRPGRNSP